MNGEVDSFYRRVLSEIITDKTASILVCGGDITDKEVFASLGYLNVVISGMERRVYDYSPFAWREENVESLSLPDKSVDYTVIHAAIHHTRLPHKVLTELYRVSKKGALAFESRDSLLIRFAERLGLTQSYEVAGNYPGMGVNGTDIPNFIYRWTEREIRKTISSYSPYFGHRILFRYGTVWPSGPDLSKTKKLVIKLIRPLYNAFVKLFPRQQNQFAFYIEKPSMPESLLPWLVFNDAEHKIEVDYKWISLFYTKSKNRRKSNT